MSHYHTTNVYATIQDVIDQAVIPALDDYVLEYDVEAIARSISEWDKEKQAFIITADEYDFWARVFENLI